MSRRILPVTVLAFAFVACRDGAAGLAAPAEANMTPRPGSVASTEAIGAGALRQPPGPPGLTGYQQVSAATLIPGSLGTGSVFSAVAECPAGKRVLGGGIRLSGTVAVLADLRVFESQPASFTSWRSSAILVGAPAPLAGSVTLQAFAICAFAN